MNRKTVAPVALAVAFTLLGCSLGAQLSTPTSTAAPPEPPTAPLPSLTSSPPLETAAPTIPPPHADWLTYRNDVYGFELRYPPDGTLSVEADNKARIDLPVAAGTNLREKYLQVDASRTTATCASPLSSGWAPGSLPTETREINGLSFTVQSAGEGAAGSFYKWISYAVTRGDVCVTLSFVLHSTNALNYTPPLVEFDEASESAIFEEIVSTYTWLSP